MPRLSKLHERASLLGDAVFAASDGLVTTFAIIAGAAGAHLPYTTVLILGFANVLADSISMASGSYLGVKSELEYEEKSGDGDEPTNAPFKHGAIMFAAFNTAGLIPLVPYIFNFPSTFMYSFIFVMISLFYVGVLRANYTGKNKIHSGFETLFVGGFASFVSYSLGYFLQTYVLS